jgi:hypothetical protein
MVQKFHLTIVPVQEGTLQFYIGISTPVDLYIITVFTSFHLPN